MVKKTAKMNSEPSNYSSANLQQNLTTFKKITIIGSNFNIFGDKKAFPGGTRIF